MIGKILFEDEDGAQELTLHDDASVTCPGAPAMAAALRSALEIYRRDYSPAWGAWGVGLLSDFARDHGGQVVIEQKLPATPGTVY